MTPKEMYNEKCGNLLVKNLKSRHFDAYYCKDSKEAMEKENELIPEGSSVGWGGTKSAEQIGLLNAIRNCNYHAIDRENAKTPEEKERLAKEALFADVFITGANAMSQDGQMVSIDGNGNRVAAIIYGPKTVIAIVGMNKVCDSLETAVKRARSVAAPMNMQRFMRNTPCAATGVCADCKSEDCICIQILITRHCRPKNRIRFIVVGEELGF